MPRGSTHPAEITLQRARGIAARSRFARPRRSWIRRKESPAARPRRRPASTRATALDAQAAGNDARTLRMASVSKPGSPTRRKDDRLSTGSPPLPWKGRLGKLLFSSGGGNDRAARALSVHVFASTWPCSPGLSAGEARIATANELAGTMKAEPVVVPANHAAGRVPHSTTASPRLAGDPTITIRGVSVQPAICQSFRKRRCA